MAQFSIVVTYFPPRRNDIAAVVGEMKNAYGIVCESVCMCVHVYTVLPLLLSLLTIPFYFAPVITRGNSEELHAAPRWSVYSLDILMCSRTLLLVDSFVILNWGNWSGSGSARAKGNGRIVSTDSERSVVLDAVVAQYIQS